MLICDKIRDVYRYERKFLISDYSKEELEAIIKLHPACFSEIYYARWVNNIYFDSQSFDNYFDNVEGVSQRCKIRIRWYGALDGWAEKPYLEYKFKKGFWGRKQQFFLKSFLMDNNISKNTFEEIFRKSDLPEQVRLDLKLYNPSLLNRYKRKYFLSQDGKYRLTIDYEMSFWSVNYQDNIFLRSIRDMSHVVLELKYDRDEDEGVHQITNYFPFRLTKNSKYVNGVELV